MTYYNRHAKVSIRYWIEIETQNINIPIWIIPEPSLYNEDYLHIF